METVYGSNNLPEKSDPDYYRVLAATAGMLYLNLLEAPNADLNQILSEPDARRLLVFPIKIHTDQVTFAISDPTDFETLDILIHLLPPGSKHPIFVVSPPEFILDAIERYYA